MNNSGKVKSLGEIALRVNDLNSMVSFYETVIQLPLIRRAETFAFFRIAEGHEGHTQVLALFDRSGGDDSSGGKVSYVPPASATSTVDHIAFNISLDDFESERQRLEGFGLDVMLANHGWVQWRSLYVHDPEGNVVEFVCFDATIEKT